jgi:predicted Rossmann fold flavoprotein
LDTFDTLVIGGGPSGLFAALNCHNKNTVLLEKNASPGKKLLISGSGQCNFTHEGDIGNFLSHYGSNFRFLKPALLKFTNIHLINFFAQRGLEIFTDKNGKIFPASLHSEDVLKTLMNECLNNNVQIYPGSTVERVEKTGSGFLIKTLTREFRSKNLVIATGGMSYPSTGSTGDGYHFAKQLGHSIVPPKPSLTPVFICHFTMAGLAGVSLQDVPVLLFRANKKIAGHRGDIGFTHKGLSGPGILDFSRNIQSGDIIKLNIIKQNTEIFRQTFMETAEKEGKMTIQILMKNYDIPRNLMRLILEERNLKPDLKLAQITREQRNNLVISFCEYPFEIESTGGFAMAMTTRGGVSLNEVSSKTMESKLVKNLYFAGEVLDIDGDTGGYNLQAAFSTAYLAAEAIHTKSLTQIIH